MELLRIALADTRDSERTLAVLDREARMPGRGAYLCRAPGVTAPAGECLSLALRRHGISRTLRTAATLDPKLVESL
jgi:predicted RNA-binding protein YlxR (DUF448 family)